MGDAAKARLLAGDELLGGGPRVGDPLGGRRTGIRHPLGGEARASATRSEAVSRASATRSLRAPVWSSKREPSDSGTADDAHLTLTHEARYI